MISSSLTDIGESRELNQDYFFASQEAVGALPCLFVVADGMGGHQAGDYASRRAVEVIADTASQIERGHPADILRECIARANTVIKEYGDLNPSMQGMGTTVVAAVVDGSHLTAANVGDSRLYVAGDALTLVTCDHSLVWEMVRNGEISADNARNHPDKNIITRAVGVSQYVDADIFERELSKGEKLLLCSDGLTNMVPDEQILSILNLEGSIDEKAGLLIEAANKNGGRDNITVIIVDPQL